MTNQIDGTNIDEVLRRAAEHGGKIEWAMTSRPVLYYGSDPATALINYKTGNKLPMQMAELSHCTLSYEQLLFHAIQRGAIRDILLCPEELLYEGMPTEVLSYYRHQTISSF